MNTKLDIYGRTWDVCRDMQEVVGTLYEDTFINPVGDYIKKLTERIRDLRDEIPHAQPDDVSYYQGKIDGYGQAIALLKDLGGVEPRFDPEYWWEVAQLPEGTLYMENVHGCMVLKREGDYLTTTF